RLISILSIRPLMWCVEIYFRTVATKARSDGIDVPRRSPRARERPRLDYAGGFGYRHWHDGRADGQVVPGVFPGFVDHGEQIRRHRPRSRHKPTLLSDDGGRYYGR